MSEDSWGYLISKMFSATGASMADPVTADVRSFWMNVALGLKDEMVRNGKRIGALEAQLRDRATVTLVVQGLCYNALRTDGAQHKQWFLEEILWRLSTAEEYKRVRVDWEPGVEP